MKQQKHHLAALAAGVFLLCVLAPAAVSAHAGRHAYGSNTQPQNNVSTGDTAEIKDHALFHLNQRRAAGKPHSTEVRQRICTAREFSLNVKIASHARNARTRLQMLDSTYAKVQYYQTMNPAVADDFAAANAKVAERGVQANDAITALTALSSKIDCTADDPALAVAGVQMGIVNAQVALQNYRKELKDLVVSLRLAAAQKDEL